jgi:hypothetical protein
LTRRGSLQIIAEEVEPNQCADSTAVPTIRNAQTDLSLHAYRHECLPDADPTDHPDSYEAVTCPACTRIHLINKITGRLLSEHE